MIEAADTIESIRQQLASRDAEIAELKRKLNEPVLLSEWQQLEKERDKLHEQVKMLREALLTCSVGDFSTGHVMYPSFDEKLVEEALAATEPAATRRL